MGKRADRARAKAEALADETVSGLRAGAYEVVDGAEDLLGKAKRRTRRTRRKVDEVADRAERKIARMRRQTDRRARRIRRKAQKKIDKATARLD